MAAGTAILIVLAAAGLGLQLLRWLRVRLDSDADRVMLAVGLGLLVLAYAILAVGLAGWLTKPVLVVLGATALLVGGWRLPWLIATVGRYLARILASGRRWRARVALAILVIWLAATIPFALLWPTSNDYDGLAQHLVYPATYLRMQAVRPLWYDHHSHFPATLQMLYVPALAFGGPAGPKVMHFAYGLLTLVAAYVLTRRHLSKAAAKWVPVVIISTPLFGWMTTVTYVDLGVCAYVMLAVHMFLSWWRTQRGSDLALAGVMAGAAMAVKMQGIPYFGVLLLAALYICWRRRTRVSLWQQAAAFGLIGAAIASPWYIKSWIITGNPVYPFAYSIFGGKQWSEEQAATYTRHQKGFGVGELPSAEELAQMHPLARIFCGPRRPDRLLLAPIYLTFLPWEFEVAFGFKETAFAMQSPGPLYLGFVFLLLGWRRSPRTVLMLVLLIVPLWAWWLYSMQLARYLLPTLLLLAPLVAYSFQRCLGAHRLVRGTAVGLMVCGVAFPMWVTFCSGYASSAAHLLPNGRDELLLKQLDVYEPSLYISKHLPADAKLLTYGEPRVFYFNRDAMWGDPGHHQLIPYDRIETSQELVGAYRALGITHVLINEMYFPDLMTSQDKLKTLIRCAIDEGLLTPMGYFPRHPHFRLLRVAAPAEEPKAGGA